MKFIGREAQIALLQHQEQRQKSVITAVFGRRRIGKTTLVEHALRDSSLMKFEGLENGSSEDQKQHFIGTLYRYSGAASHRNLSAKSSWTDLLIVLSEFLGREKKVLFLDEFQWMAAEQQQLVREFKYVYDNFFLKTNNLHVIICGSVSSFIVKKVIRSKALYGRIENIIDLQPLSLPLVYREYFQSSESNLNILDAYLGFGGIPKYLESIEPDQSLQQNISRLCFHQNALFLQEPNRLFVSHFGKNPIYRNIVEALAAHSFLSADAILSAVKARSGGTFSSYLEDLTLSGFIEEYQPLNSPRSSKIRRYRLRDNFLKLYYAFVDPHLEVIQQEQQPIPFGRLVSDAHYYSWRGLSFEKLVREHHKRVAEALGFSDVRYTVGSWFQRGDKEDGFQVDLLFHRADKVMTLVEVKYSDSIEKNLMKQISKKIERIRAHFSVQYIQKILISVRPIDQKIVQESGFDRVLWLGDLL